MKRKYIILLVLIILPIIIWGCTQNNPNINNNGEMKLKEKDEKIADLEMRLQEKENEIENLKNSLKENNNSVESMNLISKAISTMEIIKSQDMEALSQIVHPSLGVRFTPYSYIDIQKDLVFSKTEVSNLANNNDIKNWGNYDGSGAQINLNFHDYYEEFIYDEDFINPHIIGNNTTIGTGNTINNLEDIYINGDYVEFHFTGFDPEFAGIDWRSLTLVFEELNGEYFLVGVIHGEWTI